MKVVFFGWKRDYLKQYLLDCETIAKKLVLKGYDLYTGAGGGFMMMGNKGAYNVDKTKSFGVTVKCLMDKEGDNNYILPKNLSIFDNFAERKNKLYDNSDLIVFFPGGMGTLDEFTEIMNLIKTKEHNPVNIILYGYKYWQSLISWFEFNNIKFPHEYIKGIADNVKEFDEILSEINKSNTKNDSKQNIKSEINDKNINNYLDNFIKSILDNFNTDYNIIKTDDTTDEICFEIIIPYETDEDKKNNIDESTINSENDIETLDSGSDTDTD